MAKGKIVDEKVLKLCSICEK